MNVLMVLLNKQHESQDNPTLTAFLTIIKQLECLVYAFEIVLFSIFRNCKTIIFE